MTTAKPPANGPGHGGPPRRYSWPPFEPGNRAGERHGAYSPRRVDPLATRLVEGVLAQVSYLAAPEYAPALWSWGRTEARVQLLSEWIDEHGPLDEKGNPRPALEALRQFERQAADLRSRLGLDPLSRARLGRDVTSAQVDLARMWAEEAAQEPAHTVNSPDPGDGTSDLGSHRGQAAREEAPDGP